MRDDLALALVAVFVPFSLVSLGGGTSIVAGIQHESVDVRHWLTAREFIDLFAISRAAPGPGLLLSSLIGWHLAGWTGALIATAALIVPSSLLCYAVALVWRRYRGRRWHRALEEGLVPVGIGLVLAGAVSVLRVSGGGLLSWALAFASAALLTWRPKLHPLIVFALGGAVFALMSKLQAEQLIHLPFSRESFLCLGHLCSARS
jgi:chromate transporter